MIGIKTNKGYHKVIECSNEEEEKKGIIEFFNIINEIKPSIIGGYNSANFDWHWIFERSKMLRIDTRKVIKSLNPRQSYKRKDSIIKLANEVEKYVQTSIWGYNVIDIIHAVRRAQAINSSIKSAGLKYITKYINAEAEDRVYIDHSEIGKMYRDKEDYWLNIKNGKYGPYINYKDKNIGLTNYLTFTKKKLKDITLEDIEYLSKYPRVLGTHKEKEVELRFGPYGEYIQYNKKFYKIPKDKNVEKEYLEIIQSL
jgi:DNA polymerase elongation subunit (family B)